MKTVAEVAAELGCSPWFVRDSVKKGRVTPIRLGEGKQARYRFTDENVAQLVASLRPQPAPQRSRRRRRVA